MLRKSFVIISITLLAISPLSACGRSNDNSAPAGRLSPAAGAPAGGAAAPGGYGASATPTSCPTKATRKFAKTRFVVNAGLAAGTFKRYIYTPYRNGAFKSGAQGRKKAIVKAAAAAVFILDQLRRARNNVHADPTLCKALSAPLDRLSSAVQGLMAKLKKGDADPTAIGGVAGGIAGFKKDSADAGAAFKEKTPPAGSVGG